MNHIKIYRLAIICSCLLSFQANSISQINSRIIPEKEFLNDNRQSIDSFPLEKMPKGIEQLYMTVYEHGTSTSLHGKCKGGFKLIDSIKTNFVYNELEFGALYKNGQIELSSGTNNSASESIAFFILENNKLVFLRDSFFNPNDRIQDDIEIALKEGNIKEAAELYMGLQYSSGILAEAQLTLLERAHEVAVGYSKSKDYKKAAETMGYAYNFYMGINEESNIEANSLYAHYIADYSFYLLQITDYNECIKVSKEINKLSPGIAGPYLHLGNSLYETGHKEEALKAYQKFLDLRISKKEQNKIPDYIYQRLNISRDSPDQVVYKFFFWYFSNMSKFASIEMVNAFNKEGKPYRVNFKDTEEYLSLMQSSGFVGKAYIDHWRAYFKKCDENFIKEPQHEGPPDGFEYDYVTNCQESVTKTSPNEFILLEKSGTKARVKYEGCNFVYVLELQSLGWKIVGNE